MAELADIVIDAAHPSSLARFWAALIDGAEIAPYDAAEIARLADLGITDVEDDPTVLILLPNGLRMFVRLVEERAPATRLHLDLVTADLDAESARLVGLGASTVARHDTHVVMRDPEGNVFCVFAR